MTEEQDRDEVDVFVSPRKFGGRTPGPKVTMQKVFEEDLAKTESSEPARKDDVSFDGVRYNYERGHEDADDFVHKSVGRNNSLRRLLVVANYIMVLLGISLVGLSIWVLLREKNGGIFAFLSRQGVFIRSPIATGLCLMVAAGGCIIGGYFVGVRHVAPSTVEGLQLDQRKKVFIWYQVLCAGTVVFLGIVFFCSLPTLHTARRIGITTTTWQDMSISHPDRICLYEVANMCAGAKDHACSMRTRASANKGCPGHFCTDTCKVTSPRPATDKVLCTACLNAFRSSGELSDCRESEGRNRTSGNCISNLQGQVTHFLTVVVVFSGVGIGILIAVILAGTISPILNSRS